MRPPANLVSEPPVTPPVELLACPLCRAALTLMQGTTPAALICALGHRYDAAKQGYFNMLTGRGTAFEADTAMMVQSRIEFLESGHYGPLAELVAERILLHRPQARALLDAGAGTGYYAAAVQRRLPGSAVVALDISKYALRRTARLLPRSVSIVWDIWRDLPVRDHCIDVVLNIFAPRNPREFHRVLRPDGLLAVVTPRPGHLADVARRVSLLHVPAEKDLNLRRSLGSHFALLEQIPLDLSLELTPRDIRNVALMGPAARHLDADVLGHDPQDDVPTAVAALFTLSLFAPRAEAEIG